METESSLKIEVNRDTFKDIQVSNVFFIYFHFMSCFFSKPLALRHFNIAVCFPISTIVKGLCVVLGYGPSIPDTTPRVPLR